MKLASNKVNIQGLQVQMKPVLQSAAELWLTKLDVELVITCGMDGMHSAGSYHYYGYAVDLRTWGKDGKQINRELRTKLVTLLRLQLKFYSPHFDVIEHTTHIHVEFDAMKAGVVFR